MHTASTFIKVALSTLLLCVGLSSYAQDFQLKVSSFSIEENSLTAKNEPVRDGSNQKCALVIVSGFGDEKLRFNVGNTFSKVEEKRNDQGERVYLLWISEGTVKVIISSDSKNFTPVEYFFNPRVKKAETYLMGLSLLATKTLASKQYLEFNVDPKNAYIEVNDEPWEVNNGIAYRQVPRGVYQYRIQTKDYHTEVGTINFNDLTTKKVVSISLKPNFGWLTITPQKGVTGISIFIDNERYSGEFNRIKLSSGQHNIKVTCEKYLPYSQTVEIVDALETKVAPILKANFSTVNITTRDGASIYIDNELVGTNSWNGELSVGSYLVEIKKDNHKSKSETISIPKIGEKYSFNYDELSPILGSVSVESSPLSAYVEIDGKQYGTTPILIPEIISGTHNICLTLKGYESKHSSFEVNESKLTELKYTLNKESQTGSCMINSIPSYANVRIDGIDYGTTPLKINKLSVGEHSLSIFKKGYKAYNGTLDIKPGKNNDINISLQNIITIGVGKYSCEIEGDASASIFVDKKYVGSGKIMIKGERGERHKIVVHYSDSNILKQQFITLGEDDYIYIPK